MASGFSSNTSRYLPDFFNPISSGNYGSNIGNTSSYSPISFGGSDPRSPGFRTNLGSLYGMSPDFHASMGLQPNTYYGSNMSFYGSNGQSAPTGGFGLGTGLGALSFTPPSDINAAPSFDTLGTGSTAQYGAGENVLSGDFSYQPQYGEGYTTLGGNVARGGAARGLITDRSGTSYGDAAYNMNKPGEYSYRQSNYTPYGMGLSTGEGSISGTIDSPNANDVLMNGQINTTQGGTARQIIDQGQGSWGNQNATAALVKDPSIWGLLGNQGVNINDYASVGANAQNNALNTAQLRMPGSLNSSLNATSGINAANESPIFGNPVNAGVDLQTGSDINLNTGDQGYATGTASSNTTGSATSGMNQNTTMTMNPLSGKPKYYTYKTPDGTLDITTDQNVAAQAASYTPVDTDSHEYQTWVSTNIPNSIKEDFGKLQAGMPGVFGKYPDFNSYAVAQYSQLSPTAQAQVNQNTTGTVYNDLGQITTEGNQFARLASGAGGNIAADLNAFGVGSAAATQQGTSMNTGANTQTNIGASGNTFGVFNNDLSVGGNIANTNPRSRTNADINSRSNAQTRGFINTQSGVSTLPVNQNTGGMGGGVFGVAPVIAGESQGAAPVIVPARPNPNIQISNTNSNLNNIFSPFKGLI